MTRSTSFSNDYVLDSPTTRKLSGDDYQTMYDTAVGWFEDYIMDCPDAVSKKKFHEYIYAYVTEMAIANFTPLVETDISDIIAHIVRDAGDTFFETIIPRRVYADTMCYSRCPDIPVLRNKIQLILDRPQPDQRTGDWYRFRHSVLTASNAWKAMGTPASYNSLIYEKCQPLNIEPQTRGGGVSDSPCHHGQKYEPLSTMIYEWKHGTRVGEFGCVPHNRIPFLAASPDGINVDESSSLFGRMVEIKNVVSRVIDGNPKTDYWIQMQLQMEVCDLNDCDFLETSFAEYGSHDEFVRDTDGSFNHTADGKLKGSMIYFDQGGIPLYCFAPLECSTQELYTEWEEKTFRENAHLTWVQTIRWRMDVYSCVLVLRNRRWFAYAEKVLTELWRTVERERIEGFDHRAPKKRKVNAPVDPIGNSIQRWARDVSGNCGPSSTGGPTGGLTDILDAAQGIVKKREIVGCMVLMDDDEWAE
jgi:putative phage-type endonuclease